jgi:hypothetical protein
MTTMTHTSSFSTLPVAESGTELQLTLAAVQAFWKMLSFCVFASYIEHVLHGHFGGFTDACLRTVG